MKKTYTKDKKSVKVTFELPPAVVAESVAVCGEFNNWDPTEHMLKKRKDGRYSITVALKPGHSYRYRYLLDGERWENDWAADAYVQNEFGAEDSVVRV